MTDSKIENGWLIVKGAGQGLELRRQNGSTSSIKTKQFADESKGRVETLRKGKPQEWPVTFELVGGQPQNIRISTLPVQSSKSPRDERPHGSSRPRPQNQPLRPETMRRRGDFHNPYNFIPAIPRDAVIGDLGDDEPVGHHTYHPNRFSGVIRVRMTAHTPLLLPDAARMVEYDQDQPALGIKREHKSYPVRVDVEGKPYIPSTSIKGMLRSAYEAVTNSRMAVFAGHEDRLADRMPAREGLSLVPARIVDDHIELLPGTSTIQSTGHPDGPMYAAWLPRYDPRTGQEGRRNCVFYPDGALPQHGDEVDCWLVEVRHRSGRFTFWGVNSIFRRGQATDAAPPGARKVDGYVCITNRNIDRKHDERIFFTTQRPIQHPLTETLRRRWRELIANYQAIHAEERRSGMEGPPALNNSFWSRQIVGGIAEQQLDAGTLCYAAFRDGQITALYPVMISRRLYERSPLSLLPESLHPADSLSRLSPAERVFGWVKQCGKGAYRGNLRVGQVICESDDAIENFGTPGLPLAILGQPKPQQARFYVGASSNGEAQAGGQTKEAAGYSSEKGLRGRKVYPHHQSLPEGHWNNPLTKNTQIPVGGHFPEYRRPQLNGQEQRDNQNRSIQGWVKPSTGFTFDLHITNLSRVELGALLWLLNLPEEQYHRLGGGKPLGFGSVRLEIESSQLHDGQDWKQIYSTLDDLALPTADHQGLIREFQEAVRTSYGSPASFGDVSFIAAFLGVVKGFEGSLPIHYPRAKRPGDPHPVPPQPDGQNFEWFVANDRTGQNGGPKASLADLATGLGLPMLDVS